MTEAFDKKKYTEDFVDRAFTFNLSPQAVRDNKQFESDEPCHWCVLVTYNNKFSDGLVYCSAKGQDLGAGVVSNWGTYLLDTGEGAPGPIYANIIPRQGKLLQAFGRSLEIFVELVSDAESANVNIVVYQNLPSIFRPFTITQRTQTGSNLYLPDFATHVCFLPTSNVGCEWEFFDINSNTLLTFNAVSGNESFPGIYIPLPPETAWIFENNSGATYYSSFRIFE